ncbi:hypothetical protein Tco_1030692 [Tanacetum coccineum]|uniref:Uncharacterized protein n=1 Tax=Tanacetum coccineum TaxID=301880 RepID=A0ABQ5G7A3_9ASTR
MSQPANDEFSQHLSDDEESNHEDASDTGAAPKQQQQVIPQTTAISNIKLPILKKEEYDIWAMEMEHYLEYIDNDVWKVIQNGNSKKRISTGKDGVIRILPPVTAVEIQAVEKERKAKNILLMAIPKEHMRRFHGMDDAKEIGKSPSELGSKVRKGNMTAKAHYKLKTGFNDAYSTCTPSTLQPIYQKKKKKALAGFADELFNPSCQQSEYWTLLQKDRNRLNDLDIEEIDINWQIAMIAIRMKKRRGHMMERRRETFLSTPRSWKAREESDGIADNG